MASDKRSCVSSSCEEERRWDEERRCNTGLSMEPEASSEANDRSSARPVDFTRLIGRHCSILRFSKISNARGCWRDGGNFHGMERRMGVEGRRVLTP